MALADRPTTPPATVKGPTCSVGAILAALPPDDAAWLRARLVDPAWSHAALRRVLQSEGYHVQQQTLARHTRGDCKCDR